MIYCAVTYYEHRKGGHLYSTDRSVSFSCNHCTDDTGGIYTEPRTSLTMPPFEGNDVPLGRPYPFTNLRVTYGIKEMSGRRAVESEPLDETHTVSSLCLCFGCQEHRTIPCLCSFTGGSRLSIRVIVSTVHTPAGFPPGLVYGPRLPLPRGPSPSASYFFPQGPESRPRRLVPASFPRHPLPPQHSDTPTSPPTRRDLPKHPGHPEPQRDSRRPSRVPRFLSQCRRKHRPSSASVG